MITRLSSRNSLPARVLPPASPCPRAITPWTSTCPSKMDLTEMESLWCAERELLWAQKHTKFHFLRALLQAGRWVYISLQIHGERKGDGKSIVQMVWGVWLSSPPQHSYVTARSDGCLVHSESYCARDPQPSQATCSHAPPSKNFPFCLTSLLHLKALTLSYPKLCQ